MLKANFRSFVWFSEIALPRNSSVYFRAASVGVTVCLFQLKYEVCAHNNLLYSYSMWTCVM